MEFSTRLPLAARLLDPREAAESSRSPIRDACNIPLSELPGRLHELPRRDATVLVAAEGALARATIDLLESSGRTAKAAAPNFGAPGGRLWEPNPFLTGLLAEMPCGQAIDIGCGAGREAAGLAAAGWSVVALDRLPDALARGKDLARRYLAQEDAARIDWLCVDLRGPQDLPEKEWNLVCAFRWFDEPILSRAAALLAAGGSLVLEAFTPTHRERNGRPSSDSMLATSASLSRIASGLKVRLLEEGWRDDRHTARLWAIKAP